MQDEAKGIAVRPRGWPGGGVGGGWRGEHGSGRTRDMHLDVG